MVLSLYILFQSFILIDITFVRKKE